MSLTLNDSYTKIFTGSFIEMLETFGLSMLFLEQYLGIEPKWVSYGLSSAACFASVFHENYKYFPQVTLKSYKLSQYKVLKLFYVFFSMMARGLSLGGAVHELTKPTYGHQATLNTAHFYALPVMTALFGALFELVCQVRKHGHPFKKRYHRHFEAIYEVVLSSGVLSAVNSIFLRDARSFSDSDKVLSGVWSFVDFVFESVVFPATFLRFLDEYIKPSFSHFCEAELELDTLEFFRPVFKFLNGIFDTPVRCVTYLCPARLRSAQEENRESIGNNHVNNETLLGTKQSFYQAVSNDEGVLIETSSTGPTPSPSVN